MNNLRGTPIQLQIPNPELVFNDYTYNTLFDYDTPELIEYGGGSSGKSEGVYQKFIVKAMQQWEIPRRIAIWRKVGATLKDSSFQHVKDILSNWEMLQYCKVNKTDLTIKLPNNAEFLFKGLDDPEKAKSIKGISDNIFEELTEFTLDDYTQVKMRTRDKTHLQRQNTGMLNPVSKLNWVYPYFFEDPTHAGAKLHHSTYKDNKFLDEAVGRELEMLALRNPAYYRIYALGEFATLDKLVFPTFTSRLISHQEVNHLPIYLGLDFGYINDPSALIVIRYDAQNKRIYIMQEYVKHGMLNNEIAQAIEALAYQKEIIYADSSEEKSIEEIRQAGIQGIRPVKKGPDSVIQGIQWIMQHEIIIDERCFKTIEEFQNYTWKKDKKTGLYFNEPVDSYNHTIDAIRYALVEHILGVGSVVMESSNVW